MPARQERAPKGASGRLRPARAEDNRPMLPLAFAAALVLGASAPLHAAVIVVEPGGEVATLAEAVKRSRDGDVIELRSGDYHGDVAVIERRQLTIRGMGARPRLIADGRSAEGKAIVVVRGGDVRIDNVEFRGARVPSGNGAGIRLERGRLHLSRCAFFDNQMGLLTGNDADAGLAIDDSEFGAAPREPGLLHHLLYVGRIGSLTVTGSRFSQGYLGHLVKSRARRTTLAYNLIVDGSAGSASYEVDLPNGGDALLVGNVVGQSAASPNLTVVSFGAEGDAWADSRLRMVNNTLVSASASPATFVRVWGEKLPAGVDVVLVNNLTVGPGRLATPFDARIAGNAAAAADDLVDVDGLDFRLPRHSKLRGRGVALPADDPATPRGEFVRPVGTRPISPPAAWSPGAFQR